MNSKQKPSTSEIPAKKPDKSFIYAMTDAFAMGFKARGSKPAEMIAKYLDKAMRKGQGKSSNAEFQSILDKALGLYQFTEDKDVFRTFYHRSLAKRLLLEKSASDDFERAILKKLKEGMCLLLFVIRIALICEQNMTTSSGWAKICLKTWRCLGIPWTSTTQSCLTIIRDVRWMQWFYNGVPGHSPYRNTPSIFLQL